MSQAQQSDPQAWRRLVGTWSTEAVHRLLPGGPVGGNATYEWLDDQRLLIQRMHYFDVRGVHRVFDTDFTGDTWRFRTASLRECRTRAGGCGRVLDDDRW